MPHAGYPWQDFVNQLDILEQLVMQGKDHGYYILIGGDFNLDLGQGARGQALEDFCSEFEMIIANDSDDPSADDNWTYVSTAGVRRRIDFILYSAGVQSSDTIASSDLDLGSDHRYVRSRFQFEEATSGRRYRKKLKGWQPRLDDNFQASEYHKELDAYLDANSDFQLEDLPELIVGAAESCGIDNDSPQMAKRPERSKDLLRLLDERRRCQDRHRRT